MHVKWSFRTVCKLLLVAILGFWGVRSLKPFHAGYMAYSGPGSMEGRIHWISRQIAQFKMDHEGKPPSPSGMWDVLLGTSDRTELGDFPPKGKSFGPYFPWAPENPLNGSAAVSDKPAPGVGWVYKVSGTDFTFCAVNAKGDAVLSDDEAHLYYFRRSERAHVARQREWNNWGGLMFGIPLVIYLVMILVLRPSLRARRKALGLCLACGYDIRAHEVGQRCPECGEIILEQMEKGETPVGG